MLFACYRHAMANLQVKNVPAELHEELRRRASDQGVTVREYVLNLLRRDQAVPSKMAWLEHHRHLPSVRFDRPVDELIRQDREERWAHLDSLGPQRTAHTDV